MLAAATADVDAKFGSQRSQAALQRADNAGGDARGMPVHSHDRAEGLKPEWVRKTAQQFVSSIMVDDRLRQDGAKAGHAVREPSRHGAAMQRQIGAPCPSCHPLSSGK